MSEAVATRALPEASQGEGARRLHPATIYIGFLRNAPSTLIGLPAFLAWTSDRGLRWILAIVVVIGATNLFFNWLRWRRLSYQIGDGEFVIEQGLLSRSRRSIPLERIQDVSIDQGVLARMFNLADVRIETGGSEKDEGRLASVSLAEAYRLRAVLRGQPVAEVEAGAEPVLQQDAATAAPERETLVFELGIGRLLLSGLFAFSLFWLAAIFGLLQTIQQAIDIEWEDMLAWFGVAEREIANRLSIRAVVSLIAIVLAISVVTGVVRTFARDFGFRLSAASGRLRRVHGLLARSEAVIAIRQIQLGLVRRGLVAGWLGWRSLQVQTLGGSNEGSGRHRLAPFARENEVRDIAAIAGLPAFEPMALRPVAMGHVLRALLNHALLPALLVVAAGIFFPPAWGAMAVVPVLVVVALVQRRFHRYAMQDASLQVTRGALRREEWTVPYGKIQTVTVRRGLVQRLLGVATVEVDTAGAGAFGRPHVRDVALDDAQMLVAGLIERSA